MEVFVEIGENVRGEDVFVIQSTCFPANDNVMELLALDALRRGSARRVTAVLPYYGYARQDRKSGPRTPISAKLLANLITSASADRAHDRSSRRADPGFFDIPTDTLRRAGVHRGHPLALRQWSGNDRVAGRWRRGAGALPGKTSRRRPCDHRQASPEGRRVEVMNIIGDVSDRHCIMVDDIVDSGGTLCNAAQALIDAGALSVDAYVTHGVLSGGAVSRVAASPLNSLVTTDSIPATEAVRVARNIRHISVAPLLGEAIRRINEERSVSTLF